MEKVWNEPKLKGSFAGGRQGNASTSAGTRVRDAESCFASRFANPNGSLAGLAPRGIPLRAGNRLRMADDPLVAMRQARREGAARSNPA